ncbi:hypothetical protein CIW83_05495 [Tissierella sp. P1]|uniref:hypothetical protein n=1 Tax=Tissierella sp. P1 TaxID=1280483 RepID=UPI000BA0985F|nr:hypothetical protein [Tissierella sp. P1]OZV13001.1 hypothetical protein CIW83_05495 [Tissierella sp. P1]
MDKYLLATEYYVHAGEQNSDRVLDTVSNYLKNNHIHIDHIVISSTTGFTAYKAIESLLKFSRNIIICKQDLNEKYSMNKNVMDEICRYATIVDIPKQFLKNKIGSKTVNILRQFSEGTKVCIELALYLIDNSYVNSNEKILVVAGTLKGADTSLTLFVNPDKSFKVMNFLAFPEGR